MTRELKAKKDGIALPVGLMDLEVLKTDAYYLLFDPTYDPHTNSTRLPNRFNCLKQFLPNNI